MKVITPEISWHGKEAVFSIDFQCTIKGQPQRLATAGLDTNVRVWQLKNNEIKFLSNLSRHDKAVNVVRFAKKSLLLASGGDDGTIVLWKLNDKEDAPNIFDIGEGENVEVWNAFKILRGHLEDINDICWSHDDLHLVSGSVDHTAILWDVEKGLKLAILSDSKHFVNGVAWDPLNSFVATMSCDRSLRIYNIQTKKMVHCVNKASVMKTDGPISKPQRIFHDETVVRRRLSFTVDGKLLITPAGCLQTDPTSKQVNTAMIFTRYHLSKPCVYLPGFQEPACVVSCCPVVFELRSTQNAPTFKLDYRHIFAVASSDTVLLYDTQQPTPFAVISNIHYASITDLSWSSDASFLAISSRDGFCSIIFFSKNELGLPIMSLISNNVHKEVKEIDTDLKIPPRIEVTPTEKNEILMKVTECEKENETTPVDNAQQPSQDVMTKLSDVKDQDAITKADSDIKTTTSSPKPRRVLLETVSSIPGGSSPLAEKQNSVTAVKVNPTKRRVQLIPVEKLI